MSIKTEEHTKESVQSPIKDILSVLFWVIFSIIAITLIVKSFELFVNRFGMNSFFYLLLLLFSIGLIPVFYKKISKIFSQGQKITLARYFQDELRLGYFIESEDEDNIKQDYLDLDYIMSRKNLKIDKQLQKEDRKIWLKEERELFPYREKIPPRFDFFF